jgi:hypothetical protein
VVAVVVVVAGVAASGADMPGGGGASPIKDTIGASPIKSDVISFFALIVLQVFCRWRGCW